MKNRKQGFWALATGVAFAIIGIATRVHWLWYVCISGLLGYGVYYSFFS